VKRSRAALTRTEGPLPGGSVAWGPRTCASGRLRLLLEDEASPARAGQFHCLLVARGRVAFAFPTPLQSSGPLGGLDSPMPVSLT